MAPPDRYRIRKARPEDAAALAAIEAERFGNAKYEGWGMTARSFRQHAAGANALLVSEDTLAPEKPVAGYALGFVKRGSPYVRFYSLAVGTAHEGKGAGGALFRAIEDFARAGGYRGVRLEIREDNTPLLRRYSGMGYRVFARVEGYYPDGAAAIRMVRDLPAA